MQAELTLELDMTTASRTDARVGSGPLLGGLCECGAALIEMQDGALLCENTAKIYEARYGVPVARRVA